MENCFTCCFIDLILQYAWSCLCSPSPRLLPQGVARPCLCLQQKCDMRFGPTSDLCCTLSSELQLLSDTGCRMTSQHSAALLAALLVLAGVVSHVAAAEDIKIQSIDRKIALNSQLVRVTETIKVKNNGGSSVDRVLLCHGKQPTGTVALQKITQVLASKTELAFSPANVQGAPGEAVCWEAVLSGKLAAGEVATVEAFTIYADVQTPNPAEIAQGDPHLMEYRDFVYVLSPYSVSAQTTEVVLPTSNVKSYTDTEKPVAKSDNKLKFGKYDLVKPWTVKPLYLHYEHNKPFKKVTKLVKEIELSHWGNIYVEENYEVTNAGAKHKGSFSRLKYAHSHNGKSNSFRDFKARLAGSAHSLYYVDLIGNISTSNVRKRADETIVEFEARYPLLGGWKADFKLGYSLPLTGHLFSKRSDGKRRLTLDLGSSLEDVYVEELVVKVVLPEGATNIKTVLPFPVDSEGSDVKYTYLDVTGRPVVVLTKRNAAPEHNAKFSVDYSFSTASIVREPLLLVAAFAALFSAVIAYNRLEFTISKDEKWQASQEADKITAVMQQINSVLEEQDEVLSSITKLVAGVRSAEDADAANKERAALEAAFKALEDRARALVNLVATTQPRVADKVRDLQERSRGLLQRCLKQLTEKCDLIRKGTPPVDVNRKLSVTPGQIADQRKELVAAIDQLFTIY